MVKLIKSFVSLLIIGVIFSSVFVVHGESAPYTTYTYSYSGDYQISPNAFVESSTYAVFEGTEIPLKSPNDIVTDSRNYIYIADTGNNRILVLNSDYKIIKEIKGYVSEQKEIMFNAPQGVFISHKNKLYIADTGNANIVEFNSDFNFVRIIPEPNAELLPENFNYQPTSLAVDKYDRFYVISSGTNMGVITFDNQGVFEGFIGAAKVQTSATEKFWRKIMSEEQLNQMTENVPSNYNNISIDSKGFIYVTSSTINAYTLQQLISSRSRDSAFMPIKKLNPAGKDVLNRTGFFPPVGDLNFSAYESKKTRKQSSFTEVTVLDNNVYSVVDSKYNKIFTYNEYGDLLYVFGGTGTVDGTFDYLQSIAYQGKNTILAIDRVRNSLTVFQKTEYGKLIDQAIELQQKRMFSETIAVWEKIEKMNNNYDLAYVGIGKSLLSKGEYSKAMEYFKAVNDREYYSKALQKQREIHLKKMAILIPIIIIVLLVVISKFFKFNKKYNLKHRYVSPGQKRTVRSQILYGFYTIFHPFDGYWDLKNEKRGGILSATFWLVMAAISMLVKDFMSGYLAANSENSDNNMWNTIINLLLPVVLWCVANWCLTSLMDGKGKLGDIYISVCYSLIPFVLLVIPFSLIANFLIIEELAFLTYAVNAAYLWVGMLIFSSSMVTHDYSAGKNILVCLLTFLGMAIIIFIVFLFFNVTGRLTSFAENIFTEISFRF